MSAPTGPLPGADRRAAPRAPARLSVAYDDGERQLFLRARDLSERGIFLALPDPPPPGTAARLVVTLPREARMLRLRGTVRRVQEQPVPGFAVAFAEDGLDEAVLGALRHYVNSTIAEDEAHVG